MATKQKTDKTEISEKLSKKFPSDQVLQREGGFGKKLDYVPINRFIERMNEVLPLGYSWTMKDPIITDNAVIITGTLCMNLSDGSFIERGGIGADKLSSKDPDKSVKTAMAEAFKKAAHTLGVSLYLWDESERKQLARERANAVANTAKIDFTSKQIKAMKKIKSSLGIVKNDQLDKYITEFSSDLKSSADLTTDNIDNFVKYMKDKYEIKGV